jgi:hypothetical protein
MSNAVADLGAEQEFWSTERETIMLETVRAEAGGVNRHTRR